MATTSGNEGVVKVGTDTVGEVTAFSFTNTAEQIEDTAMGDSAKTYLPGLTDGSGSVTCRWDAGDADGQEAMTAGSSVTLHLMPEGDTATDVEYTGTAVITSEGVSSSMGAVVERTYNFQGFMTRAVVS